jgi:hypothetical protein
VHVNADTIGVHAPRGWRALPTLDGSPRSRPTSRTPTAADRKPASPGEGRRGSRRRQRDAPGLLRWGGAVPDASRAHRPRRAQRRVRSRGLRIRSARGAATRGGLARGGVAGSSAGAAERHARAHQAERSRERRGQRGGAADAAAARAAPVCRRPGSRFRSPCLRATSVERVPVQPERPALYVPVTGRSPPRSPAGGYLGDVRRAVSGRHTDEDRIDQVAQAQSRHLSADPAG